MNKGVWDNLANVNNGAVVIEVFVNEVGMLAHKIHRAPTIRQLFVPELYMVTAGCVVSVELDTIVDAITLLYEVTSHVNRIACKADVIVAAKNAVADELFNAFNGGRYVQAFRYPVAPSVLHKVVFLVV